MKHIRRVHRPAGQLSRITLVLALLAWPVSSFLDGTVLAAAGGKPATKLVNVADTRGMAPGLSTWIADLYNTNLWLFGVLVVVIMAGMGAILGLLFDRAIGLLGIKLGKLEHHE